jgi:hypothetical protein
MNTSLEVAQQSETLREEVYKFLTKLDIEHFQRRVPRQRPRIHKALCPQPPSPPRHEAGVIACLAGAANFEPSLINGAKYCDAHFAL